jgi:hypothetical protein
MSGMLNDAPALKDIHAADPSLESTAAARCCSAAPMLARMETVSVTEGTHAPVRNGVTRSSSWRRQTLDGARVPGHAMLASAPDLRHHAPNRMNCRNFDLQCR